MKRLADKPFVLLGVNSDDTKDKVIKAVQKHELSWRSWWDGGSTDGPIQSAYNVRQWPTIYVLDQEGVIRFVYADNSDLDEKALDDVIDKLVAETEKKGKDRTAP